MKRIHPLVMRNYLLAAEQPVELMEVVSELGIYGSLIAYVIFQTSIIIVLLCKKLQIVLYCIGIFKVA